MSNFHFPTGVQELHGQAYNHDGSLIKASHATAFPKGVAAAPGLQQINPATAISSSLQSSQTIDFNIQTQGVLENVYAYFTIANGSNTTAATAVWAYFINRVEVLDGLGNILQTLYADNLIVDNCLFMDRDAFGLAVTNMGISSTFSTVSITTATSATFMVPIPGFWEACHVNMSTLNSALRLRFVISQNNLVTGDSTLLTLSDFKLYCQSHVLGESHSADVQAKRSGDQTFRYIRPTRVCEETVTASSTNTVRLSSGVGQAAWLWFVVRPSSVSTTGNCMAYSAVASGFELKDRNNNIVGAKVLPVMNKMINSRFFPGQITAGKDDLYLIPFAIDPVAAKHGQQVGALELDSYHQLSLYNALSGSYTVTVYAGMYSKLTVDRNGVISSQ